MYQFHGFFYGNVPFSACKTVIFMENIENIQKKEIREIDIVFDFTSFWPELFKIF